MAAEFAAAAAANAVGNLTTEYASPYVSYFFHFGKIVEEFRDWRKQLELKKDRVKNDVDAAIMQTEAIEKDVQWWLEEAEKELEETKRLEVEIERQKCFNWCPNWGWRYCFSKKVAKTTPRITKLLQRCDFQRMGIRPPLQGIEFFPSKDFKSSKSSNLAFDGIMRALNANGVNMIGLYGMPGVGKTTLAKEVGRQAKEQKLFDNVLMVTMSQTPNINRIQGRIAELLSFEFKASTEEGKAEELMRRLNEVKKILIIIDDVWNEFKLHTIGIPFGVEHEGCKILLTTRLQQVCVQMKCQEMFRLHILSEDEAWALFKDTAGLNDATSKLIGNEAKKVASESKGLPLALVTIGKALKGADLNGWQAANKRLKDSRHLDDVPDGLYNCLKLSYDYLKGDDIRLCFLLCSLFPEDFNIGIEWLIMFGSGYGLFPDVFSMDVLRGEIREALKKLQESGLLLEADDEEKENEINVRMHDVVRDFAHWTTLTEKKAFMVKEGSTEWPTGESFRCCTSISFWKSDINNFPDKLEFPKLKMFVFEGKNLVRVPSTFIEGMKVLQILHLKNVFFSLEAIKVVRNLRTLCFENCELENISSLKYLENLEILALFGTNIYELPEELVALRRLKSLHFHLFGRQEVNFPPNLLSRLTSLQELHVTCKNNVNLSELYSLSRLAALTLAVSTNQIFRKNFIFPAKLQSFRIAVNNPGFFIGKHMKGLKFRSLAIKDFSSSQSVFKELFCNAEKLNLMNCHDVEYLMDTTRVKRPTLVFSNLMKLYMNDMACLKELCHGPSPISFLQKLKDASITRCPQLETIFQIDGFLEKEEMVEPEVPPLSNLTHLRLWWLPELKWILKGSSHHVCLQSLEEVEISDCDKLKCLFSPSLAKGLVLLQRLTIKNCNGLEYVFQTEELPYEVEENEASLLSNLKCLELQSLPELKWILKGPSHHVRLQSLEEVEIRDCDKLKYLFSPSLAQGLVLLQRLMIKNCNGLEYVFQTEELPYDVEENEASLLSNLKCLKLQSLPELKWILKGPSHHVRLQSLEEVEIRDCDKLKYLFSPSLAQGLVLLQRLMIKYCNGLEYVFQTEELPYDVEENEASLLSNLKRLELESLSELKWILKGPSHHVRLQSLEEVEIRDCVKLKYLFSPSLAQGLVLLQRLTIKYCNGLEYVFQTEELPYDVEENEASLLSNLKRLELVALPELKWILKGPNHHVRLQSLEEVEIRDCDKLKCLFSPSLAQGLVLLQ